MERSIDEMTDAEVAEYLAAAQARSQALASPEEKAGGAPHSYALLALLCAIAGLFASIELLLNQHRLDSNPGANLSCDINPLVGCSDFLLSEYNSLIGPVPNAVWGLAFFTLVAASALALLAGRRLPRWYWLGACLAMVGASAYLGWFWWVSFSVKKSVCPYCLLTWAATIPLIVHTFAQAAKSGQMPCPEGLRRFLARHAWLMTGLIFLAVLALGLFSLRTGLALLF